MVRLNMFKNLDAAGFSAAQIAERLKVSTRTVTRWRNSTGRSHTPPPTMRPESDREHARRLIDDGCSLTETAETVGVTPATIRRWFPDATGWSRRDVGLWRQMLYDFDGQPRLKEAA